jgi:hypothetical protein
MTSTPTISRQDSPRETVCHLDWKNSRPTVSFFGSHLQAGQNFHLFAAMIEGRLLADDRLHAAYPGREFRILDIQFDIGGQLADAAVRA